MFTLAAWLHNFSPFIIRFSDSFGIRWYGVAYLTGFIIAYFILVHLAKRGLTLIPAERVGDAMLWLIGGTLVGGRLGYVLFYQPDLLTRHLNHAPYWGLLAINEGGMASHGGMIGLTLACWRISRGWKEQSGRIIGRAPLLHVMDMVGLVAPFGVFLGRLANFVNGELLGKIVTPPGVEGPWWTVQYPQELELPNVGKRVQVPALQDPDAAEKLLKLLREVAPDRTFDDGIRILIGQAKESQVAAQLKPLLSSRMPSQLFQAFAEGVVIAVLLWALWLKPRKAGVITGVFFISYGVLRILTEIWRLPDAQFEVGRPFGLSRGQWLSVAMLVVGFGLLAWIRTQPLPKFGGWLRRRGPGQYPAGSPF